MYNIKKEHLDTKISIIGVINEPTKLRDIDSRILHIVYNIYRDKYFEKIKKQSDRDNTNDSERSIDGKRSSDKSS